MTQWYIKVLKQVRLNPTHYFIMKTPNKRQLQQMAISHSSDIDFKNFMQICKKCIAQKYFFLVNDAALISDNPSHYRQNIFKKICNKIMATDDQIKKMQKYQFYH